MPRISVIIPTYNRAALVREAVESVLGQTYSDFEVVVIDDGSTDETEEVLRSFDDPRVKVIRRSNGGVAAARNSGLIAARGDYLAFLDSDDLALPERLSLQLSAMEENPDAGLVYGLYYGATSTQREGKLAGNCYSEIALSQLLLGPLFLWSTVMIRRTWLEQVGSFFEEDLRVGEEWELTLRLALAGCPMICVPEAITIKRSQLSSLGREAYQYDMPSEAILNKAFADPRMPPALRGLQPTACAVWLVSKAASAFLMGDRDCGRAYLERALETDPTLAGENRQLLVERLTSYVVGLSLDSPAVALSQLMPYLPGPNATKRILRRHIWGKYYADEAFRAHRSGSSGRCTIYAVRAITSRPAYLKNRGLVSILLRSVIGDRLFNSVKEAL
jgi:glycosyltransferase involved in cell wall biosynthesis